MKYTFKAHFSWRKGLRRTFAYTIVETIWCFQTGPYNFHWIRIFVLSSLVSKPICRHSFFFFSPLATLQTFVSEPGVFVVVLTSCSGLNFCLEGTESMCHKTNMQNHSGLVWLNESLPKKSAFYCIWGEGSFLSPVFMRMDYLEVLQKAVASSCYPRGKDRKSVV